MAAARPEIERLRATVAEQAVALHLHEGKRGWDWRPTWSRRVWMIVSRPACSTWSSRRSLVAGRRGGPVSCSGSTCPLPLLEYPRGQRRLEDLPPGGHPLHGLVDWEAPRSWHYIYTYPAKKSLEAVMAKVKTLLPAGRGEPVAGRPDPPAQPSGTGLVCLLPSRRIVGDLCLPQPLPLSRRSGDGSGEKHRRTTWKELRRRYCHGGWWPHGQRELFDLEKLSTTRYLSTVARTFVRPGQPPNDETPRPRTGLCGEPGALKGARRVREADAETDRPKIGTALRADFTGH